jgi:hypothetical protein
MAQAGRAGPQAGENSLPSHQRARPIWHQRTGNGDAANPLLVEEPQFPGFTLNTAPQQTLKDSDWQEVA